MQIHLSLHSSPRFSTWLWFNDWKLLIDAGDGASQSLGYKLRKIDTVLLSHSHRDHIGGLLQVINQRGEAGPFTLGHPARGKSWSALEQFSLRFNPGHSHQAMWRALQAGDWIDCGTDGRWIQPFRTRHYHDDTDLSQSPGSLGYNLIWRKNKVKAEFGNLAQRELDAVRMELGKFALELPENRDLNEKARLQAQIQAGRAAITEPVDEKIVTVSGDTEKIDPANAAGSQLLLHEATFLSPDDYNTEEAGEDVGHVHSTVFDAIDVARQAQVPNLVLYHVSTRYSDQEIRESVHATAKKMGFQGTVWAAFPRKIYSDFWRERPIWEGS